MTSQSEQFTEYRGFTIVVHREGISGQWTAYANPSNLPIKNIPVGRFGIDRVGGVGAKNAARRSMEKKIDNLLQTELVIVSCCAGKKMGGDQNPLAADESSILKCLSPESREKLLEARADIQRLAFTRNKKQGRRVSIELFEDSPRWMPALNRYAGNFFLQDRRAVVAEALRPAQGHVDLVIVSALYGLLAPWEMIRWYDLNMSDDIANSRQPVGEWWKNRGLGAILIDFVKRNHPKAQVHNHLSGKSYSESVSKFTTVFPRIPSRGTGLCLV